MGHGQDSVSFTPPPVVHQEREVPSRGSPSTYGCVPYLVTRSRPLFLHRHVRVSPVVSTPSVRHPRGRCAESFPVPSFLHCPRGSRISVHVSRRVYSYSDLHCRWDVSCWGRDEASR